jgi:hypothetical protein
VGSGRQGPGYVIQDASSADTAKTTAYVGDIEVDEL